MLLCPLTARVYHLLVTLWLQSYTKKMTYTNMDATFYEFFRFCTTYFTLCEPLAMLLVVLSAVDLTDGVFKNSCCHIVGCFLIRQMWRILLFCYAVVGF